MKIKAGSGSKTGDGYGLILISAVFLAVFTLCITFAYPAIDATEDHTADAINRQYLEFTGSKPASESVWCLTGIYTAYGSDKDGNAYTGYGTTPDGWLYGQRIINYTPSQYSTDPDSYSASWTDDGHGGHFYYTSTSTTNNQHTAGDLYGYVVMDVNKKSNIFFSSSGKVESGDNFYYQFSGGAYRYAFQPTNEYVTKDADGNTITVVPNQSSLSLIWYDFYAGSGVGGGGIAGQLIISYEDKNVAYLTDAQILSAFNSDTSTSKFTMTFAGGVEMNIFIRLDPSKLASGLTVAECYNLGYWSIMVSSTSVDTDSVLSSDYEFNPYQVFQTMIHLLTFNTADYGLTGMAGALATLLIVIPFAVGIMVIGLNNYIVLILAGLYAVLNAWSWGLF